MSQNWPQQPGQPQQPGNPYPGYPQGQYPQQVPSPYSPYQMPQVHPMAYGQAQMQGLGGQFSRAGWMLMVTGILMGLCGVSCGAMGMMPLDQLEQIMANAKMDPELAAMMTPQFMRIALFIIGGGSFIYAVLAVILGIFVRRQSKGATIAAIVVTLLVIVYLLINMVSALLKMGSSGAQALAGICVVIVPLIVSVWQLMWLIGALKSVGPLRAMQGQMQMQYWQMMQMQQQQYQQMMSAQQQGQGAAPQQRTGENSELRTQNSEEKKDGGETGGGQF